MDIIPNKLTILRDIDLLFEGGPCGVVIIMPIEKMTEENYKSISVINNGSFELTVTSYDCDICNSRCDIDNPVYTNKDYKGADICTNCINKSFKHIKEISEFNNGPVYSLEQITRISRTG